MLTQFLHRAPGEAYASGQGFSKDGFQTLKDRQSMKSKLFSWYSTTLFTFLFSLLTWYPHVTEAVLGQTAELRAYCTATSLCLKKC